MYYYTKKYHKIKLKKFSKLTLKSIGLITAVALISGLLISCSKSGINGELEGIRINETEDTDDAGGSKAGSSSERNDEALNESSVPVTLTVYSQLSSYKGEQTGWFAQVLKEKFNVILNIVTETDSEPTAPDIFIFSISDYYNLVEGGFLLDWNKNSLLSEYGSYIKDNMPAALRYNASLSADGKVYGLGNDIATSLTDHELFFLCPEIRWDLYRDLGYPKVETLEDYIGILAAMKEICPVSDSGNEAYGMSLFSDLDYGMIFHGKALAGLFGYDELGMGLYNVYTREWEEALGDGGIYFRCLKFFNKLYQYDLLDPDSSTQGYMDSAADYKDGAALFGILNYIGSDLYNTDERISKGKAMYPLVSDDMNILTYGLNLYGGSRIISISSETRYPELCMKIINWMATPEGRMICEYGPRGVTWDYDENGKPYLTELGLACKEDMNTQMSGGYSGTFADGTNKMDYVTWDLDAANPDSNGETYNYATWASYNKMHTSYILDNWKEFTGFGSPYDYMESRPHCVIVSIDYSPMPMGEELLQKWEQVSGIITEYSWKAIYARSDKEFDAIVAEMKTKAAASGYNECVEYSLQEAARRKAAEDEVYSD